MHIFVPVIISGGVGSRLWPLSREEQPKQFLPLDDDESLLQKTFLRALSLPNVKEIVTVTNSALFFRTKDVYQASGQRSIHCSYILEPCGRNTAPAIAISALYIAQKYGENAIALVLPADHIIKKQSNFADAVDEAIALAKAGNIVTFGVNPTAPKTAYGYIQAEKNQVLQFVEKPDKKTAEQYLAEGNFYWNAGMFCFRVQTLIEQMYNHSPVIMQSVQDCLQLSLKQKDTTNNYIELDRQSFEDIEDISIDYALMEKSSVIAIVPCDIDWSDVGSWIEFGELTPPDSCGNHVQAESILVDVHNCIIQSNNRLIAAIGLNNMLVIDSDDALLVANKNNAQEVKQIFHTLKKQNQRTYKTHRTRYRPWGAATVLQKSEGFIIKRIDMNPSSSLKMQIHQHRSEHWIVVSGKAQVIRNDEVIILHANESTFIPMNTKHRLENPFSEPLVLIEVQCGTSINEDDIVVID